MYDNIFSLKLSLVKPYPRWLDPIVFTKVNNYTIIYDIRLQSAYIIISKRQIHNIEYINTICFYVAINNNNTITMLF